MAMIKGVWVWNETISMPAAGFYDASFTDALGAVYRTIKVVVSTSQFMEYRTSDNEYDAFYWKGAAGQTGWAEEQYRTIDFGDTEQEITDEFYTWLTTNATQQAEPTGLTISYKDTKISLEFGKTATLHLAGHKMTEDMVVTVSKDTGDDIPEWDGSYTITVSGDIELISFTIDGDHYEAEDGMTWGEWVDSEYNTGGAYVSGDRINYQSNYVSTDGEESGAVTPTDVISAQGYSLWGGTSGGGMN